MVREYKKREKKKSITIYDELTHPDSVTNTEQMTLLYSDNDWLWFSEVMERPVEYIRIFWENDIDIKPYESKIIFTINRENYDEKKWYHLWLKRIKDFIDFLWTDYIAVGESLHSVIDLKDWKMIKYIE